VLAEQPDRLRHGLHRLVGAHDAQVHVGHQRDRAPALVGLAVEHDRARLGDRDPRGGDDGGQGVEVRRGERVLARVAHDADVRRQRRQPRVVQPVGGHHPQQPVRARPIRTRAWP